MAGFLLFLQLWTTFDRVLSEGSMGEVEMDTNTSVEQALRTLYAEYAQGIYQTLLEKCGDPLIAKDALKGVFQDVYKMAREAGTTDITAIWMDALAKAHLKKRLPVQGAPLARGSLAQPQPEAEAVQAGPARAGEIPAQQAVGAETNAALALEVPAKAPPKAQKGKAGKIVAMTGLGALIIASLWAIAGLLMSMQILPGADLGYQWFNAHVYNVF